MVIVSAKVSKRKIVAGIVAALCVIALLAVLLSRADEQPPASPARPVQSLDGGSDEERLAYLQSFGWQLQPQPSQTQEVRIPQEFNDVFTRYNQLQQRQGFDLGDYAGKAVKRYVYPILNHPQGDGFAATVLVYRGKIIGGDVTGPDNQPLQGFAMPTA